MRYPSIKRVITANNAKIISLLRKTCYTVQTNEKKIIKQQQVNENNRNIMVGSTFQ